MAEKVKELAARPRTPHKTQHWEHPAGGTLSVSTPFNFTTTTGENVFSNYTLAPPPTGGSTFNYAAMTHV